jgi:hypothetical protein
VSTDSFLDVHQHDSDVVYCMRSSSEKWSTHIVSTFIGIKREVIVLPDCFVSAILYQVGIE